MNADAATIITEGFLKGACDVFDAMLSLAFSFDAQEPEVLSADQSEAIFSAFPILLQGRIQNDLGAVALLFSEEDAAKIVGLIMEQDPPASLDEESLATLKEMAEPALGSGVTNLMERFGRDIEQMELVGVRHCQGAPPEGLEEFFGPDPTVARFSFSGGDAFSCEAAFLSSEILEEIVPDDATGQTGGAETEASLSPDEMNDILSAFPEGDMEPESSGGGGSGGGRSPAQSTYNTDNLDLIMDIRLNAIARLGRVEMPIGDILNLGPGSIIEVGHLVDEPVELLINDKIIARGDVVVVDEKFGLRITEILSTKERIESLG